MSLSPETKAAWVAALRSGKYPQGQDYLKHETDGVVKYCCLGVFVEINGYKNEKKDSRNHYVFNYKGHTMTIYPSLNVLVEHGFPDEDSFAPLKLPVDIYRKLKSFYDTQDKSFDEDAIPTEDSVRTLIKLNDDGVPFDLIADVIEAAF